VIYFLFFLSGLSALIYQLVWVRVFGNVFGNTIYSASLIVAVFMLGLGAGSYIVGRWADQRYAAGSTMMLRAYAQVEIAIALLGAGVSLLLPHLAEISAAVSSYSRDASGWYVLSMGSYLARAAITIVLLTPITVLMGGTLTLLIRHLVRSDLDAGSWHIALLYAVNTGGAALGACLTDFALVPSLGLRSTQMFAVACNVVAGLGAWYLAARGSEVRLKADTTTKKKRVRSVRLQPDPRRVRLQPDRPAPVVFTAAALLLSGFAAMGMEILWFRHFSILLGGFRAVFALLLTVILGGIGAGSLAGGLLHRRTGRPAESLMVVQCLFVASALAGLAAANASAIDSRLTIERAADTARLAGEPAAAQTSGWAQLLGEAAFNGTPILVEVGLAALLMGFSFPLANALVQRAELVVGTRAGALYLANTAGAVCGSLLSGFLLLPALGIQGSATLLAVVSALAIVPLYLAARAAPDFATKAGRQFAQWAFSGSALAATAAIGLWLLLPPDHVLTRSLPVPVDNERVLSVAEAVTEVISVNERPGAGRTLLTNGHAMSSTSARAQRYMRALAHVPLLSIDSPETVLVIGFGVGNTTHASTLHPSIRRVEVADLSKGILGHASYFADVNRGVLTDRRVAVHVNDGRHHLQMQPPGSYDLITLEPPPPGYAGMAALYSREFYTLARTRLTAKGYISQWLPAYQLPSSVALGMVRAFIEVFPRAVLISGAESELLLLGAKDLPVEIDPERIAARLSSAPPLEEDLRRIDLGSVREIVGSFVGSPDTLAQAARDVPPVTDDRPTQEYGVRSLLNMGEAVPASLVDLRQVERWCPKCFDRGAPGPLARGLDSYLALMELAYRASPREVAAARHRAEQERRLVAGSAYLGSLVPESADMHNILGIGYASAGDIDRALAEFREALRLDPGSAATHWHLGAALAARGAREEAIAHLRRSLELDPTNQDVRNDLRALTGAAD
jgi:spermidine synthase